MDTFLRFAVKVKITNSKLKLSRVANVDGMVEKFGAHLELVCNLNNLKGGWKFCSGNHHCMTILMYMFTKQLINFGCVKGLHFVRTFLTLQRCHLYSWI